MFALTNKTSRATALAAALFAGLVMTMAATASWADRHGDHRGGDSGMTYQSWRNGGWRNNNGGQSGGQHDRGNWGGNGGQSHDRNWGGGQSGGTSHDRSWGGGQRGSWGGGTSRDRSWSGGARGGWGGSPSYRSWNGGGITYRRSYGGGGYYRRGGWGGSSRFCYRPRTVIRFGFGFGDPYYYGYDPYIVEPAPVIVRSAPTIVEDPGTSFDVTNEPPAGCYYYDSDSDQRFSTLDDYTDYLMQNRSHSRTCEIVREDSGETIHTLVFDGDVWRVQN